MEGSCYVDLSLQTCKYSRNGRWLFVHILKNIREQPSPRGLSPLHYNSVITSLHLSYGQIMLHFCWFFSFLFLLLNLIGMGGMLELMNQISLHIGNIQCHEWEFKLSCCGSQIRTLSRILWLVMNAPLSSPTWYLTSSMLTVILHLFNILKPKPLKDAESQYTITHTSYDGLTKFTNQISYI
jgi:hypothetical protein